MKRALEFLQESGTFYLATTEGDQPRVRPFGAAFEYEGKLYILTNNKKDFFFICWILFRLTRARLREFCF